MKVCCFFSHVFVFVRTQGFHDFIDEMLPHESPVHYGLHPNAEIEFLTVTSDKLFHTLLELQSTDAVMGEGASQTLEEKVAVPSSCHPSLGALFGCIDGNLKDFIISLKSGKGRQNATHSLLLR